MNKKQVFAVIVLFLVTLLFSLAINLPVRHLLRFVEIKAPLQLHGLSGTILQGKIEQLGYEQFVVSEVSFSFQPVCLLRAVVCYQFSSDDRELLLNVEGNPLTRKISARQSRITLESELLQDLPQLLVKPKGEFAVVIEDLSVVDGLLSDLEASIDWLGAGVQGEDQLLGNYRALIIKQPEQLSITLSDTDSLLKVAGDINLEWNGRYAMDLQFVSQPSLNPSVTSVLSMATTRSGLNSFSLKKSGKMDASSQLFLRRMYEVY